MIVQFPGTRLDPVDAKPDDELRRLLARTVAGKRRGNHRAAALALRELVIQLGYPEILDHDAIEADYGQDAAQEQHR